MAPMVHAALKEQALKTRLRSKYVFLNEEDKPIEIETLRKNPWSKALKRAKLDYRPVIQTRQTFATMMISAGENLGWVQRMMGQEAKKSQYVQKPQPSGKNSVPSCKCQDRNSPVKKI